MSPVMAYDEELAERVRAALDDVEGVAEIKMFGGLRFTVGGKHGGWCQPPRLLVRMSPEDGSYAALAETGVRLMEVGSADVTRVLVRGTGSDSIEIGAPARATAAAGSRPAPPKKPKPKKSKPAKAR